MSADHRFSVFLHLKMSWCPLYSWRIFSLDTEFWVDSYFLSALRKCCALFSGLHGFWCEIIVIQIIFPLTVRYCFSLTTFKNLSLFLVSKNLIVMCLSVVFFKFILFGFHAASWICKFMSFAKFWKFPAIFLLKLFQPSFPYPLLLGLWWHEC